MISEIEALVLLLVLGFVGGYLYRARKTIARKLRERRARREQDVAAKRRIWKRWV